MTTSNQRELFERPRENYARVDELGLPNIHSEYWRKLLDEGRQAESGNGDFIERDELSLDFLLPKG